MCLFVCLCVFWINCVSLDIWINLDTLTLWFKGMLKYIYYNLKWPLAYFFVSFIFFLSSFISFLSVISVSVVVVYDDDHDYDAQRKTNWRIAFNVWQEFFDSVSLNLISVFNIWFLNDYKYKHHWT